ncbi:DNA-3-methyladenine glycosylase I [Flavobacteriales bacterium]|jgi:DNA-3-methyladenine glycosylase I|nr:DNA-3-methyladenine glycosylase I [Flavobacteriales bacterium]
MSYCTNTVALEKDNVHKVYHDTEYGFPIDSDDELFGRLLLEINQAGLSWTTVLNKKANFRRAYGGFSIDKVAAFTDEDRERLLADTGIIRNKLKVNAAIHNAQVIQDLQKEYGSFKEWLNTNHPKTREEWVKLFKMIFKFTGGEITNEFLLSSGYLKGAHDKDCPIYHEVLKKKPKWFLG